MQHSIMPRAWPPAGIARPMGAQVAEGKEAFAAIEGREGFDAVDDHPFHGGFGRKYYPEVAGSAATDASMTVLLDGAPALYLPATISEGLLASNGMALRFHFAAGIDSRTQKVAVDAVFRHIDGMFTSGRVTQAQIRDEAAAGMLGPIGTGALNRGATASVQLNGWIDLTAGEAAHRRELRKSFRSFINWGRANMALRYVNAGNPDAEGFAALQDFHRRVAGRTTRSQASWDKMFSWITGGGGELVLGYMPDGQLAAATLVIDGRKDAYYATGVYDRERFDKPMAHWPLWNAVERTRERGLARFDLGNFPLPGTASTKEWAIGYFKRGFAMSIGTAVLWRLGDQSGTVDAQ
jgi:hypothetical protein